MKYIFYAAVAAIIILIVFYSFHSEDPQVYVREIESFRMTKNRALRDHDSPLLPSDLSRFNGLEYFNPDPRYKVKAKLERYKTRQLIEMASTTGGKLRYFRIGRVSFELNDKLVDLDVFQSEDLTEDARLFLPFTDETNGEESYEGGRYLNLDFSNQSDVLTIDFNLSYNPYCAYNSSFTCPVPPAENHIPIRVAAGEKKFRPGHIKTEN